MELLPDLGWQAVVIFCRVVDVLVDQLAGFFIVSLSFESGSHIEVRNLVIWSGQQRGFDDGSGTAGFSLLQEMCGE